MKQVITFYLFLQELTSPRLIKSHLPYRFLPSALHNGEAKVRHFCVLFLEMHLHINANYDVEQRGYSIDIIELSSVMLCIYYNHWLMTYYEQFLQL